jgi:hypothetical protein
VEDEPAPVFRDADGAEVVPDPPGEYGCDLDADVFDAAMDPPQPAKRRSTIPSPRKVADIRREVGAAESIIHVSHASPFGVQGAMLYRHKGLADEVDVALGSLVPADLLAIDLRDLLVSI